MSRSIADYQRTLILHGALILLVGFVVGFGFLFFIAGEIALWPIPWTFEVQLPGTYDAWRMAHMEGVVNGFMLWIVASALPVFSTIFSSVKWLCYTPIVIAWTIVLASCLDPIFPEARGLVLNEGTNAINDLAFFLFYPGVVLSFVMVIAIVVRCLRAQ